MQRIRFLTVQFEAEIEAYELPAFRGAIIAQTGVEHILFHNHLNDREYLYGYPVIQYKRIGRNPALVCIDYGVEEVHHFFTKNQGSLQVGDRKVPLVVKQLSMNQYTLQVWEKTFPYRLYNWLGLNEENYETYKKASELEQIALLERILIGNILSFAKGMKWNVDRPIQLRIDSILRTKVLKYKGTPLTGFDLTFRCNVFIPNHLGLGKGASLGYGTVSGIKN